MRFEESGYIKGYISLMTFETAFSDVLTFGQVSLEPPYELVMLPLYCSALCIRLLGRDSEAIGGPIFAVPLARVTAREVIPTSRLLVVYPIIGSKAEVLVGIILVRNLPTIRPTTPHTRDVWVNAFSLLGQASAC